MPYLGRFQKFPNLIAATGHAMLGLSLGPATGLLVGELLAGDRLSSQIGLLSPDRFGWRSM
jgi:D-amino-acid dehydrogenase